MTRLLVKETVYADVGNLDERDEVRVLSEGSYWLTPFDELSKSSDDPDITYDSLLDPAPDHYDPDEQDPDDPGMSRKDASRDVW